MTLLCTLLVKITRHRFLPEWETKLLRQGDRNFLFPIKFTAGRTCAEAKGFALDRQHALDRPTSEGTWREARARLRFERRLIK
jgi:hypothetical protein